MYLHWGHIVVCLDILTKRANWRWRWDSPTNLQRSAWKTHICILSFHYFWVWTGLIKQHIHHHEDAGNGHEDVRNGHDRLVSRDGQSHRCGCVGHQHDTEHEQEEGLGCLFQTYTQTELSDLQTMAHSCDLICDSHFYYWFKTLVQKSTRAEWNEHVAFLLQNVFNQQCQVKRSEDQRIQNYSKLFKRVN